MPKKIAVIGGGAAGFFAAIHAATENSQVVLFEKTSKLLSKVKVSGGGRCNVTHDCDHSSKLIAYYPRGGRSLRKGFDQFGTRDTRTWFENRGVKLKVEEDGRIFPISDNSQTIIDCLLAEAKSKGLSIKMKSSVQKVLPKDSGFELMVGKEKHYFDKVIVASGGSNKNEAYDWLRDLGLSIRPPVPSLFTFNVPDYGMKELMGLSVPKGIVQIPGSKWKEEGPVLITHWGFSGPGVIKLSSHAAEELFERNYHFPILINWTGKTEDEVRQELITFKKESPKKKVGTKSLFKVPSRLWMALCTKAGISEEQRYDSLAKKSLNKLIEHLVRDPFEVRGKTTFKEEFVTCGGLNLEEVQLKTFEAKNIPGLYFVGEILNVDGLTGGFNFQHAWTSGYLAGRSASL